MQCPNCGNEAVNINSRHVCLDCGIEVNASNVLSNSSVDSEPIPSVQEFPKDENIVKKEVQIPIHESAVDFSIEIPLPVSEEIAVEADKIEIPLPKEDLILTSEDQTISDPRETEVVKDDGQNFEVKADQTEISIPIRIEENIQTPDLKIEEKNQENEEIPLTESSVQSDPIHENPNVEKNIFSSNAEISGENIILSQNSFNSNFTVPVGDQIDYYSSNNKSARIVGSAVKYLIGLFVIVLIIGIIFVLKNYLSEASL